MRKSRTRVRGGLAASLAFAGLAVLQASWAADSGGPLQLAQAVNPTAPNNAGANLNTPLGGTSALPGAAGTSGILPSSPGVTRTITAPGTTDTVTGEATGTLDGTGAVVNGAGASIRDADGFNTGTVQGFSGSGAATTGTEATGAFGNTPTFGNTTGTGTTTTGTGTTTDAFGNTTDRFGNTTDRFGNTTDRFGNPVGIGSATTLPQNTTGTITPSGTPSGVVGGTTGGVVGGTSSGVVGGTSSGVVGGTTGGAIGTTGTTSGASGAGTVGGGATGGTLAAPR